MYIDRNGWLYMQMIGFIIYNLLFFLLVYILLLFFKAYIAWCNTFLQQRNMRVEDLTRDLADGVLLVNLLEISYDTSLGRYNAAPRRLAHKLSNVTQVMDFMRSHRIELISMSPQDIVDQKTKQIVILIWNLIRGLTLRGLQSSSTSCKFPSFFFFFFYLCSYIVFKFGISVSPSSYVHTYLCNIIFPLQLIQRVDQLILPPCVRLC